MNAFWRFLRDKRNQQVLGWLGGGLVVVATGLWAAFVYFFPPGRSTEGTSPEPTPPSVQANCGGIAIWPRLDWLDHHGRHHDQFGLRAEAEMRRSAMKRHLSFVAALGIFLFASITAAYAQVRADANSIAIGGSVTGSTVIIGIPQEKVDELVRDAKRPLEELTTQQRDNIVLLKEKLDLNERQVRAALGILGENDISPERLAAKLVEIAERFKALRETASALPGDDPKIVTLKGEAQKAIDAGELAKAEALLADAEAEQRLALDRLAVNAAETVARRGEISLARLRYREAAKHFANSAGMFFPNSAYEDKRISYLQKE